MSRSPTDIADELRTAVAAQEHETEALRIKSDSLDSLPRGVHEALGDAMGTLDDVRCVDSLREEQIDEAVTRIRAAFVKAIRGVKKARAA